MALKAFRTWDLLRGLPAALLILAVFAQALIPGGWMPNLSGTSDAVVVLCSSTSNPLANDQSPDDRRMGQTCPYAATVLANPPDPIALVVAWGVDHSTPWPTMLTSVASFRSGPPFGSRAPPTWA